MADKVRLPLGVGKIRPERVKSKASAYEACVVGTVTDLGLTNFLQQFPYQNFKSFTQQEYNLIMHKFIGLDLRKKCAAQMILPQNLDTASYTTELNRIHHAEMVEESIVEQKLFNYTPLEQDIVKVYHDVNTIVDLMPNSNWDEENKAKKLFFTLKKLLPPSMAINFAQMESHDYSSGMSKYPTRQQQKFYMCKNAFHINEEMKRTSRYRPRINEISQNHKQKSTTEKNETVEAVNVHQTKKIQQNTTNLTDINAAVQEIRTYLPPKCDNCNRLGHIKDNCFFHPGCHEKSGLWG